MLRNLSILLVLAIIVALPFIFRHPPPQGDWREGDPVLVIVSPHNEAIRFEFAQAFSKWHAEHYKRADGTPQPVKIDWRNIGGTSEIQRYLNSEYVSKSRSWWKGQGKAWPDGATDQVTNRKFPIDKPPAGVDEKAWAAQKEVVEAFRKTDTPAIGIGVDLFFGGGEYDHSTVAKMGLTVEPFDKPTLASAPFAQAIPEKLSGETWRSPTVFGNAISTFGIVYNVDRLRDLGTDKSPPTHWRDLANPVYVGQVGLADPTKSGSIAKAFEMIVHQQMYESAMRHIREMNDRVTFPDEIDRTIARNEELIAAYAKQKGSSYQRGEVPDDLKDYQAALEQGWLNGIMLIQQIAGNARYFTDSATKVPVDVSMGDAAAGMAIDFYGRFQAQTSKAPDGTDRMVYVTPAGGSSVSCDPISLLRGAPSREVSVRFIQFVLSGEGQRLWNYAPGTPGGPTKYALRRLPIRRDFYDGAKASEHAKYATDPILDPKINPYALAKTFTYYPRWTATHFEVQRRLIRAMCLDSGDELRTAWARAIAAKKTDAFATGLPTVHLHDRKLKQEIDIALNWRNAPDFADRERFEELEVMRTWTGWFRDAYATKP